MHRWKHKDSLIVICGALTLFILTVFADLYILPSNAYLQEKMLENQWKPLDLTVLEGFLFVCFGGLNLVGRAGIDWYGVRSLIIAKAIFKHADLPDLSKGLWRDTSSLRIGLMFTIGGVILVALYFLTLYSNLSPGCFNMRYY
jgi:hypothetical protein